MKEQTYGTWGYFQDKEGYLSDSDWIKNRCKQYVRINIWKYIIKLAVIIGLLVGVLIIGLDSNTKLVVFISIVIMAFLIWVILPPESCRRFIEYSYVELREHELVIFRRMGLQTKIRKRTMMYGPFTYQYMYIESINIAQDRIIITFKKDSPYYGSSAKYGSITLENNFKNKDELFKQINNYVKWNS